MQEKLCVYRRIAYISEMFYGLRVFASIECYVSRGHLVNRLAVKDRMIPSHLARLLANSPGAGVAR